MSKAYQVDFRAKTNPFKINNETQKSAVKYGLISPEFAVPKEQDYEYFSFRLLSADTIIGSESYKATYFPSDVLKGSLPLFKGINVRVFGDHWDMEAESVVGVISEASWQESYTTLDGKVIPAGINGVIRVNKKLHPELVAKLHGDEVRHFSMSVKFEANPSHEMDDFEWKIGSYIDGKQVHRIASKILSFPEGSVVSYPADGYASILDNQGKIKFTCFSKTPENQRDLVAKYQSNYSLEHEFMHEFSAKEKEIPAKEIETFSMEEKEKLEGEILSLQATNARYEIQNQALRKEVLATQKELRIEQEKYRLAEEDGQNFQRRNDEVEEEIETIKTKLAKSHEANAELQKFKQDKISNVERCYRLAKLEKADNDIIATFSEKDFSELEELEKRFTKEMELNHQKTISAVPEDDNDKTPEPSIIAKQRDAENYNLDYKL